MNGARQEILRQLREERERWEALLAGLSDEAIVTSRLPNGWSVKDLMAHLMAWQQVTAARLEAAQRGTPPRLPGWLEGADPDADDAVHTFNARIYELHRGWSWPDVHRAWRSGFLAIARMAEEIPEQELLQAGRYPWLNGYPLVAVLQGTYEHHHVDHLARLEDWIAAQRDDGAPRRLDLTVANEANLGSFLALQRDLAGAEVLHDGAVTWVANRDPMFWFNMVTRLRMDEAGVGPFLDRLQATHERLATSVLVWLSPLASPGDLEDRLEARGFAHVDSAPAMAADLGSIGAPPVPEEVSIERVADAGTLATYVDTLLAGYGAAGAEDIWNRFYLLAGLREDGPVQNFLGRLAGQPACCVTLFLSDDVAGIYCVATVPAARRRGIAAMVTAAALAEARRRGFSHAVLQSSAMGANVYRGMGFRDTFTYRMYGWSPSR